MSHTPAPWVWDDDFLYSTAVPKDTPPIIVKHEAYGFASEADMALIAAAPDLLAALKMIVDHFGDPLKVARAAIAKAEHGT